jgi:hypothetical protein
VQTLVEALAWLELLPDILHQSAIVRDNELQGQEHSEEGVEGINCRPVAKIVFV